MLSVLSHCSGDDGDCAVKPERQNSTGNLMKRLGSSKRLSGVAAKTTRADYEDFDDGEKGSRNYKGVYRYGMLAVWLATSAIMILDRFYWNVWPRQSVCTDGCGTDKFCPMDEDPGCLQEGPWSVKVFDAFARISARLIISTTALMFATMCHGSWNYLSEFEALRPLLYGWRGDNFWLHTVGGWSIGIWVLLHVWSLLFPSIFHGFANVKVAGEFGWLPPQVPIPGGNLNAADMEARWGVDDIWRIFWMTVIFCFLMPLSRSAWMLGKNFSLAMVLHTALGAGFFFDSVRRKTHPHVWILNTPFVIWYILDKVWCATRGRVDPLAQATRVQLDENYMLLLWRHDDKPKRICDVFWLKKSHARFGEGKIRACELAHPFTTCSSHDTAVTGTHRISPFHDNDMPNNRSIIEVPVRTDVSWPGHRFSLNSAVAAGRKAGGGGGDPKVLQSATPASGHPFFPPTPGSAFNPTPGTAINASRGMGLAWSEQGGSLLEEEKFRELDEDTMIGAESGCRPGEVAFVIGSVRSCDNNTDRSIVASSVQRFFSDGEGGELERHREDSNESGSGKDTGASGTTPAASTDESLSEDETDNNNNNINGNGNEDTISAKPPSHPHPRPKLKTALSFTSPMLDASRQSRRHARAKSADRTRASSFDRAARIGPPTGKSTESTGAVSGGGGESAEASAGGGNDNNEANNTTPPRELTGRKKSPELTRGDDSEFPSSTDRRTGQGEEGVTTEPKEKNTESAEEEGQQQTTEGTGLTSAGATKVVPAVAVARAEAGTNGTEILVKPNNNNKNNYKNKEVLRIRQGSEGFEEGTGGGGGEEEGDGTGKGAEKRRMGLKRLETPMFQEYRKMEALKEGADGGGRVGRVTGGSWNKMAIVRVHRRKEPAVRECSCLGYTHVLSSFRRTETSSIADIEVGEDGGTLPLRTYGPYRSDYGRLAEFPNLPPLLIIATGAGAALALDFVAYVRANRLMARRPVKVCYSSASLALLQFVTNTLLAESTPGIRIKTALTRHDDLELFDTTADPKDDLAIGRLDVRAIVAEVSDDTEVYFCGGGAINGMLRDACSKRGMPYTGSSVQ